MLQDVSNPCSLLPLSILTPFTPFLTVPLHHIIPIHTAYYTIHPFPVYPSLVILVSYYTIHNFKVPSLVIQPLYYMLYIASQGQTLMLSASILTIPSISLL